jgi:hypothetical protein
MRRRPILMVAMLWLLGPPLGRAEVSRHDVGALLAPDRIRDVTLSPDGCRVAYTQRQGHVLSVVVRELEAPEKRTVVFSDVDDVAGILARRTTFALRVSFLQWADAGTVVYALSLPT